MKTTSKQHTGIHRRIFERRVTETRGRESEKGGSGETRREKRNLAIIFLADLLDGTLQVLWRNDADTSHVGFLLFRERYNKDHQLLA